MNLISEIIKDFNSLYHNAYTYLSGEGQKEGYEIMDSIATEFSNVNDIEILEDLEMSTVVSWGGYGWKECGCGEEYFQVILHPAFQKERCWMMERTFCARSGNAAEYAQKAILNFGEGVKLLIKRLNLEQLC
jgi:hypothetical protein